MTNPTPPDVVWLDYLSGAVWANVEPEKPSEYLCLAKPDPNVACDNEIIRWQPIRGAE